MCNSQYLCILNIFCEDHKKKCQHAADQGLIPSIPYGPLGITRSNSWAQSQEKPLCIAGCDPKNKKIIKLSIEMLLVPTVKWVTESPTIFGGWEAGTFWHFVYLSPCSQSENRVIEDSGDLVCTWISCIELLSSCPINACSLLSYGLICYFVEIILREWLTF